MNVIETTTYMQVEAGVEYASHGKGVVMIGDAGWGKSCAAMALASEYDATYITFSKAQGRMLPALRHICNSLDLTDEGDAARLFEALVRHAKVGAYANSKMRMLILDEAQNIDPDLVKDLLDFPLLYLVPVVLCGNPQLLKRTKAGDAGFAQITSRVSRTIHLKPPTEDDYLAIAREYLVAPDAERACVTYGVNSKSIRELVFLLSDARGMVRNGELVTLEEIKRAVAVKHGSVDLLKPATPKPAAKAKAAKQRKAHDRFAETP